MLQSWSIRLHLVAFYQLKPDPMPVCVQTEITFGAVLTRLLRCPAGPRSGAPPWTDAAVAAGAAATAAARRWPPSIRASAAAKMAAAGSSARSPSGSSPRRAAPHSAARNLHVIASGTYGYAGLTRVSLSNPAHTLTGTSVLLSSEDAMPEQMLPESI